MLSIVRRELILIGLLVPLLVAGMTESAVASGSMATQVAAGPGLTAQVQIPIPTFDFNPTKWVQDAFGALLQSFSDGIRAGMGALWDANFITQTPPSLKRCGKHVPLSPHL